MPTVVDTECCIGCGRCVHICQQYCYDMIDGKAVPTRKDECLDCGSCVDGCFGECIDFDEYE